jgi:hypothetical protein
MAKDKSPGSVPTIKFGKSEIPTTEHWTMKLAFFIVHVVRSPSGWAFGGAALYSSGGVEALLQLIQLVLP